MKISGMYSHNHGREIIQSQYPHLLKEIEQTVNSVDANACRLKVPKNSEVSRAKRAGITHFFSPPHLNAMFEAYLFYYGWELKPRIITHDPARDTGYREIDAIKERLGVEVQFGKYSFLTYDIIGKMVIYRNLDVLDVGIELCLMASMLSHMSTGIGAFEQVVWDLQARRENRDDTPVMILGLEIEEYASTRDRMIEPTPEDELAPYEIVRNRSSKLSKGILKRVSETGFDIKKLGF